MLFLLREEARKTSHDSYLLLREILGFEDLRVGVKKNSKGKKYIHSTILC